MSDFHFKKMGRWRKGGGGGYNAIMNINQNNRKTISLNYIY